jgi:alpha-amylase
MTVRLVLALHFHQPVGNFDSVFRDAVRFCYEPTLTAFEHHRAVRSAFHLSGCLLEWLESNDRKTLDRVFRLVGSGQVEPLGGGFYEPILTVIPRDDALEQIGRLSDYWQKRCGVRPRGAWLPERVWEPGLADLLSDGGIRYTILDDQHLRFSGMVRDRMTGVFVTERFGKAIAFFPSDYKLRYLIPFRTMDKVREHFEKLARDEKSPIVTYGDDVEKFGFWPGTHRWVFEEKWLDQFFTYLGEERSPLRPVLPGSILDSPPPAPKVYVPNASYSEMLEWALPADSVPDYIRARDSARAGGSEEAVKAFVRGSLWDMFLARYPESDQILKHVIRSSRKVRALEAGEKRERAMTSVLRAQCNCAYWHGLFGGIYLPHLRDGILRNLLEADSALLSGLGKEIRVERGDYDGDLEEEVVLSSRSLQAFFRPSDGGTMNELDHLPSRFNLANVVSRWKESYHNGDDITHGKASSEGPPSPHEISVGIRKSDLSGQTFDRIPLRSFRDFTSLHPIGPGKLAAFEGMNLATGRMDSWITRPSGWEGEYRIGEVTVSKRIEMPDPETLALSWSCASTEKGPLRFGTLLCFTLLTPDASDRHAEIETDGGEIWRGKPGDELEREKVRRISWRDDSIALSFDLLFPGDTSLSTFPIRTLQRSEKGYEAVYQGTLMALSWPAEALRIGGVPQVTIRFRNDTKRGGWGCPN